MANEQEIIKTEASKSYQNTGMDFTEYGILANGLRYRIKIHAESLSFQQRGTIEVFNREQLEWKGVGTIDPRYVQADYKVNYDREPEAADFKADRDHLLALAGRLLD